jgi:hypothetical protein
MKDEVSALIQTSLNKIVETVSLGEKLSLLEEVIILLPYFKNDLHESLLDLALLQRKKGKKGISVMSPTENNKLQDFLNGLFT